MYADILKVMVADDAAFMRKAISGILESDPGIQVIHKAKNGLEAVEMIHRKIPDVITMDIDMPIMDGLSAIRHIMVTHPLPIVALSSLYTDGAVTFEALRLGVVDFIPKPSGAVSRDIKTSKQEIIDRIKVANTVNLNNVRRVRLNLDWKVPYSLHEFEDFRPLEYLVAIGTTLSGPNTIIRLLSGLSPTLPAALVVVQEISLKIIDAFVKQFNQYVPWRVEVAENMKPIEQGVCYICSNERSLRIDEDRDDRAVLIIGDRVDHPLDLFFTSAADTFYGQCIGVLLTGIGCDGSKGFARINQVSGITMAQNSRCCVYPNLVHTAVKKGVVDMVVDEVNLVDTLESAML